MEKPIQYEPKKVLKVMLWFVLALVALYLADSWTQGRVEPKELAGWIESGKPVTVIDVRSRGEFDQAHVPGAIHMPFTQAIGRAGELEGKPRPFVVYCEKGPRASLARFALRLRGVGNVTSLTGHYGAWRAAGLPSKSHSARDM